METQKSLAPNHVTRPALVLGLDNVIRRSLSEQQFPTGPRDIELMPGIEDQILKYVHLGYKIFVVSNQTAVAHGLKLPLEVEAEMKYTFSLFRQNPFHGVRIAFNDVNGNTHPYNIFSLASLPNLGMLAYLENESYNHGIIIDWKNSLFVGANTNERQAAITAGIPFIEIGRFLTSKVIKVKRNGQDNPALN